MASENTANDSSTDHDDLSAVRDKPSNRISVFLAVFALLALIMIPVGRAALIETDRQFANFAGIGAGILAVLFAILAIAFHRNIPWVYKFAALLAPVACLVAFNWFYEFAGFNGEVWPTFRPRLAARDELQDQLGPTLFDQSMELGELSKTPRFNQMLGNRRDGNISAPEFSMNWAEQLPQIVWRRNVGDGWSGFAVAQGMAISLEQRDDREFLTAYQLKDGETAWEFSVPGRHYHPLGGLGPRSTPTIVDRQDTQVVVAQTATGKVLCVDLKDGKPIWQFDLFDAAGIRQEQAEQDVMWGRSGSPLVINDMVIVPLGGATKQVDAPKSLIALSLTDGSERWRNGSSQIAFASPVMFTLDGDPQIVSVNEGTVTGHDVTTGDVLWTSPWPSKSNGDACASQPVQLDSNRVLISKGYAQGSKLIEISRPKNDASDGSESGWIAKDVWTNAKVLKTKFTSAIVHEGKAYGLSDGVLECVDPETGTRIWRGGRFGQGQMLIVNGVILVSAEDGRIAAVNAADGKTIAEMQVLDGITWNPPAVAGPFLLVRNGTEAVCLRNSK